MKKHVNQRKWIMTIHDQPSVIKTGFETFFQNEKFSATKNDNKDQLLILSRVPPSMHPHVFFEAHSHVITQPPRMPHQALPQHLFKHMLSLVLFTKI